MGPITVRKAASPFEGPDKLSLLSHPVTSLKVLICLFEKPDESPLFKPALAHGDEMFQTGRVRQLKQGASALAFSSVACKQQNSNSFCSECDRTAHFSSASI